MDNQNKSNLNEEKEIREDTSKYLPNKILHTNIFESLKKNIEEEKERSQKKFEELSSLVEKLKSDFDQNILNINERNENSFNELKYFLEALNKNINNINTEISYFKEDVLNIKQELLQLHQKERENIEKAKNDTKTLFDKIKPMLSILNERVENIKEEFSKYKEANEIESKQKNGDILRLINNESEILNKKREADVSMIHSTIKQLKEFLLNFQKNIEKNVKDIEVKIEQNQKKVADQITELQAVQKKMIADIYSSFEGTNT